MTDVERVEGVSVFYRDDTPALNPSDLTEAGARLNAAGFTTLESRALMSKIQQNAAQVGIMTMTDTLAQVRKIHEARMYEIQAAIRMLPSTMGYVNRDMVLRIIDTIASQAPRT